MATSRFRFLYPEWREIEPSAWLAHWAGRYDGEDNAEYFALITKQGKLSSDDFEQVGRWKEGCLKPSHGSWKTGTPKGYDIWMQAKAEAPDCPEQSGLAGFLEYWKEKTFVAGKKGELVLRYRFGLSRAAGAHVRPARNWEARRTIETGDPGAGGTLQEEHRRRGAGAPGGGLKWERRLAYGWTTRTTSS